MISVFSVPDREARRDKAGTRKNISALYEQIKEHHTAGCGKQIATLSIWLGSWLLVSQGRICHLDGTMTQGTI